MFSFFLNVSVFQNLWMEEQASIETLNIKNNPKNTGKNMIPTKQMLSTLTKLLCSELSNMKNNRVKKNKICRYDWVVNGNFSD